jgi:mRNA interferase HigB
VFNIGGNEFRLIARVEYQQQEVDIRAVLTRAEYSKEEWKRDTWFQRR